MLKCIRMKLYALYDKQIKIFHLLFIVFPQDGDGEFDHSDSEGTPLEINDSFSHKQFFSH